MRTTSWTAGMLSAVIVLAWISYSAASLVASIGPALTEAEVGDTVVVAVHVEGPDSVGWYWMRISTDESVLTYESSSTDILQGCPNGSNCMRCGPTGEPGVFEADCACFGQHTCVGIPGDLLVLKYIATGEGVSHIAFPESSLHISDCDREMIPIEAAIDGIVYVGEASVEPQDVAPDLYIGSFRGFPNPFSRDVTLWFWVPPLESDQGANRRKSQIRIFDCLGREIRSLTFTLSPGEHVIIWDGLDSKGERVPSGVYFCRFPVERKSSTYKITRVK